MTIALAVLAVLAFRRALHHVRTKRGGMIDLAHPVAWRALGDNRRDERPNQE